MQIIFHNNKKLQKMKWTIKIRNNKIKRKIKNYRNILVMERLRIQEESQKEIKN